MVEPPYGHEPAAIAIRRVAQAGAILAVTVVLLVATIRFVMGKWVVPQHAQVVARTGTLPPAPRLQAHPDRDLSAMRAQDQSVLSTWGWTDSQHEFAHVPVERAMALYAELHKARAHQ